jgi:hypothetical protein
LELNGALSNPQAGVELSKLGALHDELLRKASANPRELRPALSKVSRVLETVTLVLERAEQPMRTCEIYVAACELTGRSLLWSSVKSALSAGAAGEHAPFRRLRRGVYAKPESARLFKSGCAI